jgi:iron(II)-dependent oxidoreductase
MADYQSAHDEPDWHGQKAKQKHARTARIARFRWFAFGLAAALCLVVVVIFSLFFVTNLNNANLQATSNAATLVSLRVTQTADIMHQTLIAAVQNTRDALNNQALTATAAAQFTATAPPYSGRVPIVTNNDQWTPQMSPFNGVMMVLVPPGCFMMGSDPAKDSFALPAEQPQAKICFQQPFWIDQNLVTQEQFRQFGGKAAHPDYFSGDQRPVEGITWFEAKAYCEKQRGARLPTEAEWEWAARGPDDLIYPWGNNFDANKVVYAQNSWRQTVDVGSYPSGQSWVGALDMSGNDWEWTSTIYRPYPYNANDGRENNNDVNSHRVLRGGSWANNSDWIRAAYRHNDDPSDQTSSLGVRCARSF